MLDSAMDRLFQSMRTKKLLTRVGSGDSILDIGCNQNLLFFSEAEKRFNNYVGVDIRLKKHGDLNFVKYFVKDSLPFKDESFDAVSMLAVFEHLEKKREAMAEVFRVLKEGGRLVMTVPSPKAEPIIRLLAHLRFISKELADEHNNLMNKSQISALLSKAGFRGVEVSKFEFGLNYLIDAHK